MHVLISFSAPVAFQYPSPSSMDLLGRYPFVEVAIERAGPKLARFFRAKILTAQLALKTGSIGPNSLFKAKKDSDGPGRAGPNLARLFSGQ